MLAEVPREAVELPGQDQGAPGSAVARVDAGLAQPFGGQVLVPAGCRVGEAVDGVGG